MGSSEILSTDLGELIAKAKVSAKAEEQRRQSKQEQDAPAGDAAQGDAAQAGTLWDWLDDEREDLARDDGPPLEDLEELLELPGGAREVGRPSPASLRLGQELVGVVTSVSQTRAFVDVGVECDGLLWSSHVAEGEVENMADHLRPEQEVRVWVNKFAAAGKFNVCMAREKLVLRHQVTDEGVAAIKAVADGSWLDGVVSRVTALGPWVIVDDPASGQPCLEGQVKKSELPGACPEVGQRVRVRKLGLNMRDARRLNLNLSMRRKEEAAKNPLQDVPDTEWLTGVVHHTAPFGAFVNVVPPGEDEPIMVMVHISRIKKGMVKDIDAEVKPGQEVQLRVLGCDRGQVKASMLPVGSNADSEFR